MEDLAALALDIDAVAAGPVLVTGSTGPQAKDLDLLVRAEQLAALRTLLQDRGFLRWRTNWAKFEADTIHSVELVPAEGWGPGPDHTGHDLFVGCQALPGFRWLSSPAPHVRLLLVAQSMLVARGKLTPKKRARAVEAASDEVVWQEAHAAAPRLHLSGALRMLRRALRDDDWTPGRRLAELTRAVAASPGKSRVGVAKSVLPHRIRPVLVSLSGPDGSGKSTQAARLEAAFRQVGVRTASAWVPTTTRPSLPRAVRAFADRQGRPASTQHGPSPRRAPRTSKPVGLQVAEHAWITAATLSNALAMWRPLWSLRSNQVIVFDRFVLDAEVKLLYWYALRRHIDIELERRLFRAISPSADIAVLLTVDPKTNYDRRGNQFDLSEFRDFHDLYRQVAMEYGALAVDAERSAPEVTTELAATVWRSLP